jgi:CBS domain-containing protein
MTRRDDRMDAMLRHLGAAYYESLHGRASAADVARARAAVEERQPAQPTTARRVGGSTYTGEPPAAAHHHGRWHSTVRDVMTTDVVAVDRITPYKDIVRALAENKISAVPVLTMGRQLAGVVSEADLLAVEDEAARRSRASARHLPWRRRPERAHTLRLKAEDLMTKPAVTINPDAPIPRAAQVMHAHHVKRLPVVSPGGTLIGIVSRRDLLSVFIRPDAQIAGEVRELLAEILFADPATIKVVVHGGVVTLLGQPGSQDHHDLIPVAVRLIWDIDGVVDVVDKISPDASQAQNATSPA